MPVEVCVFF